MGIFNPKDTISCNEGRKMSNALQHRGPDGEGEWINELGNLFLAHRRLSIIDLSESGQQPMISYDGRYVIVFNGEIYNYLELAKKIQDLGVIGELKGDTRVLLEGYSILGESILNELDGMFAFAIYDKFSGDLFCARDRFGEKPFYYTFFNGAFYFASEIKAFWAINIRKQIREESLFDYAYSNSVIDKNNPENTFFENIFKIVPGQSMRVSISSGNIVLNKKVFWKLKFNKIGKIDYADALENIESMLIQSLRLRLRSDVELGISLSGGIDSTLLAALLKYKLNITNIKTFSARFQNFHKDEGKNISNVLERLKLTNVTCFPNDNDLIDDFERLCYIHDEPFRSPNMYAQYKVMESVKKEGITVLINGQGADEVFAGYYFYRKTFYEQLKKYSFQEYQNLKKIDNTIFGNSPKERIKYCFEDNLHTVYAKIKYFKEFINEKKFSRKFQSDFYTKYRSRLKNNLNNDINSLHDHIISHINSGLLEELLRYDDRNSMAHSLEVRLPFLDHKLIEFVLSLPEEYLIKSGYGKFILRDLNSKYLPKEVAWDRKKIGFATPNSLELRKSILEKYPIKFEGFFNEEIILDQFKISMYTLFK